MENRSRGTQLSIIFLALGAALLLAPPADAFYPGFRAGRDIAHHQRYPNSPSNSPEYHGGLLPEYEGKYPPIGKSPHYNPPARPPYYGNQPSFNIQPFFEGQTPPYNGPPVTFDGPPPSYDAPPPPPPYNGPPLPHPPPPPPPSPPQSLIYNAPPSPYNDLPPPPPPPPFNLPPPPPYNAPPPRDYGPPLYKSPYAPFHPLVYDPSRPFNSRPAYRPPPPPPSYERPKAQNNSQPLLVQESSEKNSSDSKDAALKSEAKGSSNSASTESTNSSQNKKDSSSTDSSTPSPAASSPDKARESPPYPPYPFLPPRTYLASMDNSEDAPPWTNYRPVHRFIGAKYGRPPSHSFANRIHRRYDHEPYRFVVEYPYDEAEVDEFEFDEPEEDVEEFGRRPLYDSVPPRIERRYRFRQPEDECPCKAYRPYKRHDNYVMQNRYGSENEQSKQEAERQAWPEQRYQYYDSPYATERPPFVTMQQPKQHYQLEPYRPDVPERYASLAESRETEWMPVDMTPGRELDLNDERVDRGTDEQPQKVDLLDDMEQPPPTATESTVIELLLETTTTPR